MVPQPSKLADMIEYARKLSEPFKVIRVDFYENRRACVFWRINLHINCRTYDILHEEVPYLDGSKSKNIN